MMSRLPTTVVALSIGLLLLSVNPELWRAWDTGGPPSLPAPWPELLAATSGESMLIGSEDQANAEEAAPSR